MKKQIVQAAPSYTLNRGDVCVGDNNNNNTEREQGNVVQEFKLGNTRVRICDDYCRNVTAEEVEGILKRIASKAHKQLSAQG